MLTYRVSARLRFKLVFLRCGIFNLVNKDFQRPTSGLEFGRRLQRRAEMRRDGRQPIRSLIGRDVTRQQVLGRPETKSSIRR